MGACGIALVQDSVIYMVAIVLDFAESSTVIDAPLNGHWIGMRLAVCIIRV